MLVQVTDTPVGGMAKRLAPSGGGPSSTEATAGADQAFPTTSADQMHSTPRAQ